MSRIILIGDSNVYRNISADKLARRLNRSITVHKATKQQTLEVGLRALNVEHQLLLVSALPNIICDEFGFEVPTEAQLINSITGYVDLIASSTTSTTLLVPPIFRSTPPWFGSQLPVMQKHLMELSKRYTHLYFLPEFKITGVDLIADGVHLNTAAGEALFNYVVNCIQDSITSSTTPNDPAKTLATSSTLSAQSTGKETIGDVLSYLKNNVTPQLEDISGIKTKVPLLL